MEGGRPNRLNDSSDNLDFDPEKYDQLNPSNDPFKGPQKSKKEKMNVIAIVIVGIVAIFLATYEMVGGIANPFAFLNLNANTGVVATSTGNTLSNTDTDGDGLSDYDELYVYHASPYLEDSDGDGILDGQEVKNGTDPNCPQGQQCSGGYSFSSSTSSTVPIFNALPNTAAATIDPATIRQVLIQGGMSADDVGQLTDAEILQLYQEAIAENPDLATQAGVSVPGALATSTYAVPSTIDTSDLQIKSIDDLKNLTGAQIKALMIKNGASAETLNLISDDEIKQMFLDKLNSNNQ